MIKVLNNEKELLECEGVIGIAMNRLRSNLTISECSMFGAGYLPQNEKLIASVLAKFIFSSIKTMSKQKNLNELKIYQYFLDELQKLNS